MVGHYTEGEGPEARVKRDDLEEEKTRLRFWLRLRESLI
jgi:hypothetical protein